MFQLQKLREGHSSLFDLMFGLKQRDTGIIKYLFNNRWLRISFRISLSVLSFFLRISDIINFSVTVVHRQNKPKFVSRLRRLLHQM